MIHFKLYLNKLVVVTLNMVLVFSIDFLLISSLQVEEVKYHSFGFKMFSVVNNNFGSSRLVENNFIFYFIDFFALKCFATCLNDLFVYRL